MIYGSWKAWSRFFTRINWIHGGISISLKIESIHVYEQIFWLNIKVGHVVLVYVYTLTSKQSAFAVEPRKNMPALRKLQKEKIEK